MDFDVYPLGQAAPDQVSSGVLTPAIPIVDPPGTGLDPFFIRVAMLGSDPGPAHHPRVWLKATNTSPAPHLVVFMPSAIPVLGTTPASPTEINDGTLDPGLPPADQLTIAASAWITPEPHNVWLIQVAVSVPNLTWEMQIENRDTTTSEREFTWVVADNLPDSGQPWINIEAVPKHFDVMFNQQETLMLNVENYGTADLPIADQATSVTNPRFTISALDPSAPPGTTPDDIPPNGSGTIYITFHAGDAIGSIGVGPSGLLVYNVTSDDTTATNTARHNRDISLSAYTKGFEVALVLDASGSMSWEPDGTPIPLGSPPSRWARLKDAIEPFSIALATFAENVGHIGVSVFPDVTTAPDIPGVSANHVLPGDTQLITMANLSTLWGAGSLLEALTPANSTPMGDGMALASGLGGPGTGYFDAFPPDPPPPPHPRSMFLLTDGDTNAGTHDPSAVAADLLAQGVRVFTIGYGTAGSSTVNHLLLEQISEDTEGIHFIAVPPPPDVLTQVQGPDDAMGMPTFYTLEAAFIKALTKSMTMLGSMSDPWGILTREYPEGRHSINVTPYDSKVAFMVNWQTFGRDVNVELITPLCEVITPEYAQYNPDIFHHSGQSYAIYTVNADYIRNTGARRDRFGAWTLRVSVNDLDDDSPVLIEGTTSTPNIGEPELYSYNVVSQSSLRLSFSKEGGEHPGDEIRLSAHLTLYGAPVTNASVKLTNSHPGQFIDNFLVQHRVTEEELAEVARDLGTTDVTPFELKIRALQNRGVSFRELRRSGSLAMRETSPGTYEVSMSNPPTPGSYSYLVTAVGLANGHFFQREEDLPVYVTVAPDPVHTPVDTSFQLVSNNGQTANLVSVKFWPRDRFGNVFLVDPNSTYPRINVAVEGGEIVDQLSADQDGSYSATIQYQPGSEPEIGLQINGEEFIPRLPIAPVSRLHWVDTVREFVPGHGGVQGQDPNVVLGDILGKSEDQALALGAFGSITVAFARQVILAQGDADFTVFNRAEGPLAHYEVEVLPVGANSGWVSLGTSPGVTRSFSLGEAGIKAAMEVRISDRSGRPGALKILGVGATRVGPDPRGCWALLKRLLRLAS